LQKKAQRLKNAEMRQYGLRRLGMVVDSTGWDFARIGEPATKLKQLGYDCSMVFVKTSLETALRRNAARAKVGGRDVPEDFIVTAHDGALANLNKFRELFGTRNVYELNNDADINDATWSRIVAPALRKLAGRILKQPLRNPIGKKWLRLQKVKTQDTLDVKEWPRETPPLTIDKKKGVTLDPTVVAPYPPSPSPRPKPGPLGEVDGGVAKTPRDLKKEKLGTYDDATVYLVDGDAMRDSITDAIGGANGYAYPGIVPKDEIWVERMPKWRDTAAIAAHEMIEFSRMKYGKEKYLVAHKQANDAEAVIRALLKKGGVDESEVSEFTCLFEAA
jgi:hypothetical protein